MHTRLRPRTALVLTLLLALAALMGEGIRPRTAWGQNALFVANSGNNSITVYTRTATGNTVPIRTLIGPPFFGDVTGLSSPVALGVDTVNNELVVGNFGNDSITVYRLTASGNTAPMRTLVGPATGLSNIESLVVDTVHDELLVANLKNNSITVYGRTESGNAGPIRRLIGGARG